MFINRACSRYLRAVALTCAVAVAPIVAAPGRTATSGQQPSPAAATVSAKTWVGHATEFENYIRTAPIVRMQAATRGVTRPRRAYLEPGGLVESIMWKPLRPAVYNGYHESYKAEIAAYELDKLLELNMVPPKVERVVNGDHGAAIMWVTPTKAFADLGGPPTAPPAYAESWNVQLVRAKMFHNLIGDIDPNLGNWLVDPSWNLILIDHSRGLTATKRLIHQMQRIDAALWDRMKALTEETVTGAVGPWLEKGEIRAILERRDKMASEIDKMVKKNGEAQVFIR